MNGHRYRQNSDSRHDPQGIVLLITLVILVVLATLGYTLTVRFPRGGTAISMPSIPVSRGTPAPPGCGTRWPPWTSLISL
jgi:hypothetical protein